MKLRLRQRLRQRLTFEELEARLFLARSIGVNFGADAGLVLSASEVAGFVPQANWNNIGGQAPGGQLTRSDLTLNNDGLASQSTVDLYVDADSLSGNVSGVIVNHGGTIDAGGVFIRPRGWGQALKLRVNSLK
jgi:hypothetical protein